MPDGPIPPRAQSLDPAGAAAVPPPADRIPPPPPPSSGNTADQPDTPALVRGVQLWMALDLWSALGRETADFEAAVGIDGWAETWAELNGAVRDLAAGLAKTVSNFEEHAEVTAEQLADVRHELEVLRRINRELNDGTQLVLETQRERDQLQYERRLLGFARLVLDRAAEYDDLNPVDRERLPAEAADIAQRIVDEIGHPVTDEPALGPSYREQIAALTAERDQARRDAASWEDWGRGWKTQAEANQAARDKAWAELDRLRNLGAQRGCQP